MVSSPERDTEFFNVVARIVQKDTFFIIWLDYVLQAAIAISKLKTPYKVLYRY